MKANSYKWSITPLIEEYLQQIEVLKSVFELLPISSPSLDIMRKRSFINSAVSSARIENIPSTEENPRKEGNNLIKAYTKIYTLTQVPPLTVEKIKEFHEQVLNGVSGSAGQYRAEAWGIFNEAGIEVQHAPLHIHIPLLMKDLISFINSFQADILIMAAVAHFIFEKIHPFADGNGRTGRLITTYLMHKGGYGFKGLVPIEKYINSHRSLYYQSLMPSLDCTEFITFVMESVVNQAKQTLEDIKNPSTGNTEDLLLPRRRELLETIRDHPECSFDFLHRRFVQLHSLVIHRDLAFLQKKGLIRKLGTTKGALYVANT